MIYIVICYICVFVSCLFFFFKQKTAYEMRISDWSSDMCSSDLEHIAFIEEAALAPDPQIAAERHAAHPLGHCVGRDQPILLRVGEHLGADLLRNLVADEL